MNAMNGVGVVAPAAPAKAARRSSAAGMPDRFETPAEMLTKRAEVHAEWARMHAQGGRGDAAAVELGHEAVYRRAAAAVA